MRRGKEVVLQRKCSNEKIAPVSGASCGYGMIYKNDLSCVPCSEVLNGCKLCTTAQNCVQCEDSTKYPLPIIDSYGDSFLECSAGMKVFSNCSIRE